MAPMRIGSWAKAVPTPRAPTAASSALYFMFVSSRFDHARFEHERRHADLDPRRVRWQRETLKAYADYYNRRWARRSGSDPTPIRSIVLWATIRRHTAL